MPRSLDRLPFDVLFCITSSLTFDDIVSLSLTCRQLRLLLNEGTLCWRTIETHVPHSKEAKLAQEKKITYREAVQRTYERREAFAKASPFSASIIGHGSAFLYKQGILCSISGSSIRVLDIHASSSAPRTIELSPIISSVVSTGLAEAKISLLSYCDEILALHYERKAKPVDSWLIAVSTKVGTPDAERLVAKIELESSSKLFARNTASFLYYGTHSGVGTHGHREWRIHGVSLDAEHVIPAGTPPLQLEDFVGSDMGFTVAFEIHDGYFYALSNQTSFDVEEVDWTSFYHCVRFPLERPFSNALKTNNRIYRRQHAEGPINDSWTDMSLQADESTNALIIVESRREWKNGGSQQTRTFYTQEIAFPSNSSSTPCSQTSSPAVGPSAGPALPPDDPFVALLASDNNAHWAPSQPRYEDFTHPEYGPHLNDPARAFILARTKLRAYNLSCSAFVDFVEDDKCCSNPSSPAPCLRLRIGSRRLAPAIPDDNDEQPPAGSGKGKGKGKEPLQYEVPLPPPKSALDARYRYAPITMWPPPANACPCAARLHGILNPPLPAGSAYGKTLVGVVDERSLVYMLRPARSYDDDDTGGPIVLISFDRAIGRVWTGEEGAGDGVDSVMRDGGSELQMRSRWVAGRAEACRDGTCC
ncbi:uncharacterized protein BDZ99DRAFT_4645 [Mytilinidion resinicola]|uniref:F-box domain-containing protein n=1 Tax=Mytilinidion resinicola TaxID=574789 RepID=A0A6A6Z795_9PEZI|nr:uncharacterized protein BDZ99DRAFT_4645 [Mytilinidion resinicola]KAF2816926.1 hypothetical protein BDZ99DRAFT_4645 [Mytilinidion resinicola]